MGKANRNKQADAEARQLAKEQKKQAQELALKKAHRNKLISIVCVVLAVVLIGSTLVYNKMVSSGYFMRRTVAASSETLEMDQTHASYFYNQLYSQYSYLSSYLGFDASRSLKDQACSILEGGSWFDYFMSSAKSDMQTVLQFAEEAKARGLTLDESDYETIDASIASLKKNAKSAGVSLSYYIHAMYGSGVKVQDIRDVLEMTALYSKCYNEIVGAYNYTSEDYRAYLAEHEQDLKSIDYASMQMTTSDAPVDGDITVEMLADYVARFSAANNKEAFDEIAREYLRDHAYKGDSTVDDAYIQEEIDSFYVENAAFAQDSEFFTWAFDEARKAGDTYTYANEDGTAQYVYILLSPAAIDTTATVNVRHILLKSEDFDSADSAKAKAEELLAQWKSGAATAESFGELAKANSSDTSAADGGLIEKVSPGDMVETFDAWLFADGRKAGDSGIVESEYGFHVMYLDSFGMAVWEADADNALRSAQFSEDSAEIALKHPVTFDNAALYAING